MDDIWLTVDELAAILKVSPKSIRRAYRKGEIPVDRFCRFVRFDLERVKEAYGPRGIVCPYSRLRRKWDSAARPAAPAGGARSRPAPDWVRRGRLSHRSQGGRNDGFWRIHSDH